MVNGEYLSKTEETENSLLCTRRKKLHFPNTNDDKANARVVGLFSVCVTVSAGTPQRPGET